MARSERALVGRHAQATEYRFDAPALDALQASLASYLGHLRRASCRRLVAAICDANPWLPGFVEQLQWPPRRIPKERQATARTPRAGLRRMRLTRHGSVQGFPLTQLDRRVAGLVATGRAVTFVASVARAAAD